MGVKNVTIFTKNKAVITKFLFFLLINEPGRCIDCILSAIRQLLLSEGHLLSSIPLTFPVSTKEVVEHNAFKNRSVRIHLL